MDPKPAQPAAHPLSIKESYARRRAAAAVRTLENMTCGAGLFDVHQVTFDSHEDVCIVVAHCRFTELKIDKVVVMIVNKDLKFREVWPHAKEGWSENHRTTPDWT